MNRYGLIPTDRKINYLCVFGPCLFRLNNLVATRLSMRVTALPFSATAECIGATCTDANTCGYPTGHRCITVNSEFPEIQKKKEIPEIRKFPEFRIPEFPYPIIPCSCFAYLVINQQPVQMPKMRSPKYAYLPFIVFQTYNCFLENRV